MGKKWLKTRWVPHPLTEENKANRERVCGELLEMYEQNNILQQLITVDEIWLYWDCEGPLHQRSWRGSGDEILVLPMRTLTRRKHMASIFLGWQGYFVDRRVTSWAAYHRRRVLPTTRQACRSYS